MSVGSLCLESQQAALGAEPHRSVVPDTWPSGCARVSCAGCVSRNCFGAFTEQVSLGSKGVQTPLLPALPVHPVRPAALGLWAVASRGLV